MQACASLPPQDEELASAQSPSSSCESTKQAKLLSESSLSKAIGLEDTSNNAQQLSVREAFAGRTVLLTGATGFVGSLVLEQLLRTCPDVHRVFVIARQKHGIPGPERVHQMLQNHPLFHLVRLQPPVSNGASSPEPPSSLLRERLSDAGSANPESQAQSSPQVEVLAGDMTLPGYGIGPAEMLRLKKETEIVIHAAASITFDDHIHNAITHNYMVLCFRNSCNSHCYWTTPLQPPWASPHGPLIIIPCLAAEYFLHLRLKHCAVKWLC